MRIKTLVNVTFLLMCFVAGWAQAAGKVIKVTAAMSTVDCAKLDITGGDTIVLDGGVRGPFSILNCIGTDGSRINIKNDTASASRVIIRTAGGRPRYGFQFTNNNAYINADFTGGWSGQPANACGVASDGVTEYRKGCGLFFDGATNGPAQDMVRVAGSGKFIRIVGIEAVGDWSGQGDNNYTEAHGFNTNDAEFCLDEHPSEWREGIEFGHAFIHNFNDTAMYVGNNVNKICGGTMGNLLSQRNIWLHHIITETIGEGGAKIKSVPGSDPSAAIIEYNHFLKGGGSTEAPATGHNSIGFSCFEASCTFRYNIVGVTVSDGKTGPGFGCNILHRKQSWGTQVCRVYGNVIYDTSGGGINSSRSSSGAYGTTAGLQVFVDYNTVVNPARDSGNCINLGQVTASSRISNNICTGGTTGIAGDSNVVNTNNRVGSVAIMNFSNPGGADFSLKSTSPARNSGTPENCATKDLAGRARPQEAVCDQGAFEFSSSGASPIAIPKNLEVR